MPWIPELFSAAALVQLEERWRERQLPIRYFDGLMTGEVDGLIRSFAGEPEVHDPIRGRVRGAAAFARFAAETRTALAEQDATFEDGLAMVADRRGMEEVVVHANGPTGSVDLPMALVAERTADGRIAEIRLYFRRSAAAGARPPLLQADPELRAADIVGDHQGALAAGDVEAAVATFEPDGFVRDAAGAAHHGTEALRALHQRLVAESQAGSVELCAVTDNGRACGLEYNVVRSKPEGAPAARMAVYDRSGSGRLAAVRLYGDEAL